MGARTCEQFSGAAFTLAGELNFEFTNARFVLQRQLDVVEAIQQAVAIEFIDRKT